MQNRVAVGKIAQLEDIEFSPNLAGAKKPTGAGYVQLRLVENLSGNLRNDRERCVITVIHTSANDMVEWKNHQINEDSNKQQ